MKKLLIFSLLFSLSFSGCNYYRIAEISVITDESLHTIAKYKPTVFIGNDMYYKPKQIKNFKVENGVITGDIAPLSTPYTYNGKNVFLRKRFPNALDVTHLSTNQDLKDGPITLPITDLRRGQVYEKARGVSALTTVGSAVGAVTGGLIIVLAIACNCPYVAVLNPDGTENFQGSLFPGSMFKMLERSDNLVLSGLEPNADGATEIKVYNELEEVQYIDNMQLLGVNHTYENLGLNENGELIAFNPGELPLTAIAQNGKDVLQAISIRDDVDYDFDEVGTDDQLNSLELTFNTKKLGKNGQLIIRGQQSKWLEQTAEYFFQQFGTYFPTWVEKMNDGDAKKYNQNAIDEGISMNAYVKRNGAWEYVGSYQNVGTVAKRDVTLPIDLSRFGDEVEIKLECAHAFWNVDQISLTSEWSTTLETTAFTMVSAINERSEDVLKTVSTADQEYVTQAQKGTFTTMKFDVPTEFKGSMVLNAGGYYNHVRNYESKPNKKYLKEMKDTKLSTHQLSRALNLHLQLASNQP
jgi:hypothetical protein